MTNKMSKMIRRTEIIERGWTDGNIEKFLGRPQKIVKRLGIRSGAYDRNLVEYFETSELFREAQRNRLSVAISQIVGATKALELGE